MKENTKQKLNKNVYSIKSKNESSEEYVSRGTYNSRE